MTAFPPAIDAAIDRLTANLVVAGSPHAPVGDSLRNLVGAVRDQVVKEMMVERSPMVLHSNVLVGDLVVWKHQAYQVVHIAEDRGAYHYRLVAPGKTERDELLMVSSRGRPDLQFRLLQSAAPGDDS